MKKLIVLILASVLLCAAVSCGEGEQNETESPLAVPSETEKETEKEENIPAETVESIDAETAIETEGGAPETEAIPAEGGYLCVFDNGITIEIGAAAEGVLAILGDALNVAEAPSCIHEGMDRIYTYNGFSLTTSPDGKGTDRVYEIAFTSDAVMLEIGVSIGASLDAVMDAFGEDCTEYFGVLQYKVGNAMVSVVLDEDSCVADLVITAVE